VGNVTYNSIVAWKPTYQAVGGGDAETARTVSNSHQPVGTTSHPKECLVTVIFDCDITSSLISSGYWNPTGTNTATTLIITEKNVNGQTRTVTYNNAKVTQIPGTYTVRGEQHTEVHFLTYGTVTYTSWA